MGQNYSCVTPNFPAIAQDPLSSKLYVGPLDFVVQPSVIPELGINVIISCLPKDDGKIFTILRQFNIDPHSHYLLYPLDDNSDHKCSLFDGIGIIQVIDFIHHHRVNGQCVLVHCDYGKCRSASVVVAYLMKYYGMSLSESSNYLEVLRPGTTIRAFEDDLRLLENVVSQGNLPLWTGSSSPVPTPQMGPVHCPIDRSPNRPCCRDPEILLGNFLLPQSIMGNVDFSSQQSDYDEGQRSSTDSWGCPFVSEKTSRARRSLANQRTLTVPVREHKLSSSNGVVPDAIMETSAPRRVLIDHGSTSSETRFKCLKIEVTSGDTIEPRQQSTLSSQFDETPGPSRNPSQLWTYRNYGAIDSSRRRTCSISSDNPSIHPQALRENAPDLTEVDLLTSTYALPRALIRINLVESNGNQIF